MALQFPSCKMIPIQLPLISPLSLLWLCPRFDLCFVKIAVKPATILKLMFCFPEDPVCCLSACGRVITSKGGSRRWLSSSPMCLILQSGIERSLIGAGAPAANCCSFPCWSLSPGWGASQNDEASDYLPERSACGLESCFGVAGSARVTGG